MEILLGSFVKTRRLGHRGVVIGKHISFYDSGSTDKWFDQQQPPIPEIEKGQPWVDLLIDVYGSARVPLSDCELVPAFWIDNPLVEFYLGKVVWRPGIITPTKVIEKPKARMLRVEGGGIA